jgi:hypothetical protein
MPREDEIEGLLREIAPLLLEIANGAQEAADELGATDWAREHLSRTASLNQVGGTARWRVTGDEVVARQGELPASICISTTDEEQNQGRYYLQSPLVGIVLTIRRKPHPKDEKPALVQLQMEEVLKQAPVAYDDQVVVYLAVPPFGHEPTFEVTTRGDKMMSYRLIDLVGDGVGQMPTTERIPSTQSARPRPLVRSSKRQQTTTGGSKESMASDPV